MDDLEICKRIAEIEGLDYVYRSDNGKVWVNKGGVYCGNEYNPLTDDALWFHVMVK